MTLQTVTLSSLKPPASNPRSALDTQSIEGLATSIAKDGLLQNLVVAKGRGNSYNIISGERRYRALMLLAERGDIENDFAVPVEIRTRMSKDDTLRLATIENVQRENLPPLDEATAFAALLRKGTGLDELSAKTGLSASTIKRRLVPNDLCDEAQAALRENAITLAQAEALTFGSAEGQRHILEAAERGGCEYTASEIREHFLDERPAVALAIFPLDQYTGSLTTDLFASEETSYFDDADQFFTLQEQATETLAAEYEQKADWVEITHRFRAPDWLYEKAEDGAPSGVVINIAPSGKVEVLQGLCRDEEDVSAKIIDHPAMKTKPKPVYSAGLCRYVGWHKSVAVQELLLADPRKAKEVSAVQSLSALGYSLHEGICMLSQEAQGQSAYAVLEAQVRSFADKLGFDLEEEESVWEQFPSDDMDEAELYEAVRALTDHDLDGLITLLTALSFGQAGCSYFDTKDSFFNRVARDLNTAMRNHWQPDRSFLSRRTREQLVSIAKECGYADGVSAVGSFKKSELVESLIGHFEQARKAETPTKAQIKAREWMPEVMHFPAIDPEMQTAAEPAMEEAA